MLLIGRSSKKTRSKPEKEGKNGGELWALPPPEARKTHPERLIWLDLQGVKCTGDLEESTDYMGDITLRTLRTP